MQVTNMSLDRYERVNEHVEEMKLAWKMPLDSDRDQLLAGWPLWKSRAVIDADANNRVFKQCSVYSEERMLNIAENLFLDVTLNNMDNVDLLSVADVITKVRSGTSQAQDVEDLSQGQRRIMVRELGRDTASSVCVNYSSSQDATVSVTDTTLGEDDDSDDQCGLYFTAQEAEHEEGRKQGPMPAAPVVIDLTAASPVVPVPVPIPVTAMPLIDLTGSEDSDATMPQHAVSSIKKRKLRY